MTAPIRTFIALLMASLLADASVRANPRSIAPDSVWRTAPASEHSRWVPTQLHDTAKSQPTTTPVDRTAPEAATMTAASKSPPSEKQSPDGKPAASLATLPARLDISTAAAVGTEALWPDAGEITRLAVGTVCVAGLAVVALLVLRRTRWGASHATRLQSPLQHGGSIPLGPRNSLHLVTVGQQRFLVAVDPRGVSTIAPVAESFPDLNDEDSAVTPEITNFRGVDFSPRESIRCNFLGR
jgi:flagellar biogenesis protein FliO